MSTDGPNLKRRRILTAATAAVGAVGAGFAAVPFLSSWLPSARTQAIGGPVEIDVSKLEPGQRMVIKWRGQPVWVVRRTQESLDSLAGLTDTVLDPASAKPQQPDYAQNEYRAIKPEYLVLIGICTHLGCSPQYVQASDEHALGADWKGGFFCPCHGSKFDIAGRVFRGVPAPTNLVVPPHFYVSDLRILVGSDEETA